MVLGKVRRSTNACTKLVQQDHVGHVVLGGATLLCGRLCASAVLASSGVRCCVCWKNSWKVQELLEDWKSPSCQPTCQLSWTCCSTTNKKEQQREAHFPALAVQGNHLEECKKNQLQTCSHRSLGLCPFFRLCLASGSLRRGEKVFPVKKTLEHLCGFKPWSLRHNWLRWSGYVLRVVVVCHTQYCSKINNMVCSCYVLVFVNNLERETANPPC